MLPRFPFLVGMLSFALLACSGGSGGPTAPDQPGPDVPPAPTPIPQPIPAPVPLPPPIPGPPVPPDNIITGTYVLTLINESQPGQLVTIANPDGNVIGLYRFHENTFLGLTDQQTWTLALRYEEEGAKLEIVDSGTFKRSGEQLKVLSFHSDVFGDVFEGRALDGVAAIKYDLDGDAAAETVFGFQRLLGPGD